MSPAFGLGIDFGTSNTVALMRWPDGRVRPLLFDANPLLPSAVFAPPTGGDLVVGGDALHHARFDPSGLEPNPKQHIDEQHILLGAREVAVAELIAAVLRFVFAEARRVAGSDDFAVALAHPAGWGTARREVLADAARRAGLSGPGLGAALLVPEPVAAAHAFTAVLGQQVPTGKALVVYDLGAGTFDASVVVRRPAGFEPVAVDGLTDVGGLDIDATIVHWLAERYSPADPALWASLADARDPESLRHRRMLWNDAKVAKEMLSRAPAVVLQMPAPLNVDVQLTRDEFETAAKPLLERTVFTTAALIRQAGLAADDVAGVLLVGGGSRIPLVATMLHRALGIAPTITEQPEIVVAEGCLLSLSAPPVSPSSSSSLSASSFSSSSSSSSFSPSAVDAGGAGPLWPAAAAVAAPYASMAAPAPAPDPASVPAPDPGPVPAAAAEPAVDPAPAPVRDPDPVSAQPFSVPPVSAQPFSAPPVGVPPVSAQPFSAPPVSPVAFPPPPERARGTLYQTGQYPSVPPPPQPQPPLQPRPPLQPQPRYLPPPVAPVSPVSPGPVSRVIPVYDAQAVAAQHAAVRPHSPAPAPAEVRRDRGNWLNALLVVVALLALAGAGTTIYLVQLDKGKPAATGGSPGAVATSVAATDDAGAGGTPVADVGGVATGNPSPAAVSTTTHTETVTVPDVIGLYVDYAKQKLRDSGFTVTVRQRSTDDPDQVGKVLAQDPKAQKQAAKGATITITVGAAPKPSASASPTCQPCPTPTATT